MKLLAPRKTALSPIGIDVGAHSIKAVQLRRLAPAQGKTAARWRLAAATVIRRATLDGVPSAPEISRLVDVLERQGFFGKKVVLSLPMDKLLLSVLELPPRASGAPIEQLTRAELGRTHKCDPNALEMGWWDLPSPARAAKGTQLMALACPEAPANALLDPFEENRLDVLAIDAQMLAIARGADVCRDHDAGITALLDVGWSAASLALIYQGAIVYSRLLPDLGTGRLHAALMDRLHIEADVADYLLNHAGANDAPDADERMAMPSAARSLIAGCAEGIAGELQASIGYVLHQYPNTPLTKLTLAGGGGSLTGLAQTLAKALETNVEAATTGRIVDCPPAFFSHAMASALTAALGLARYADEAASQ